MPNLTNHLPIPDMDFEKMLSSKKAWKPIHRPEYFVNETPEIAIDEKVRQYSGETLAVIGTQIAEQTIDLTPAVHLVEKYKTELLPEILSLPIPDVAWLATDREGNSLYPEELKTLHSELVEETRRITFKALQAQTWNKLNDLDKKGIWALFTIFQSMYYHNLRVPSHYTQALKNMDTRHHYNVKDTHQTFARTGYVPEKHYEHIKHYADFELLS